MKRFRLNEWLERVAPERKESEQSGSIFEAMKAAMMTEENTQAEREVQLVCFIEESDPVSKHMDEELQRAAAMLAGRVEVHVVAEERFRIHDLLQCTAKNPLVHLSAFPATYIFLNKRPLLLSRPACHEDYAFFGPLSDEQLCDFALFVKQTVEDTPNLTTLLKVPCDF